MVLSATERDMTSVIIEGLFCHSAWLPVMMLFCRSIKHNTVGTVIIQFSKNDDVYNTAVANAEQTSKLEPTKITTISPIQASYGVYIVTYQIV